MADVSKNATRDTNLATPLEIGNLVVPNRAFLAPMSGVSDAAFRKMAWKTGAGLVFSEMVASEALVTGKAEMAMKSLSAGLPIHAVQIAGREAKWMGLAAQMARDNGADLIDINMGCPSRRVTSGMSGSALMRDLDNALSLITATVAAVDVPVTLKMRLGWDDNSINAPQLAARAQEAGVAMITVHGRTRCQFYKGTANWNAIAKVREVVSIPLIVNGDIIDRTSAANALRQSGADGVMIGRASYGMPWLPGMLADGSNGKMNALDICEIVKEHFETAMQMFGCEIGIRHFRKHLGWYLDNFVNSCANDRLRRLMMTSMDPVEVLKCIELIFDQNLNSDSNLAA